MKNKCGRIRALPVPVALAMFLVVGVQTDSGYADEVHGKTDFALEIAALLMQLDDSDAGDLTLVLPPITTRAGPDHDGDGTDSDVDTDDDDDRISDTDEGLIDNDNDGIPDAGSRDSDGDGVVDGLDSDSDNDGIPDWDEGVGHSSSGVFTPIDTDGDLTPDYLDLDSDGDGIFDLVEAGGADADGNGRVDNFTDTTGKGIDDSIHASSLPVFDTDIDGLHDYRDLDSDNDTIPDNVEAGPTPTSPTDTDGDGAANYREKDSDSDGIPDAVEVGANPLIPADMDGDGAPNYIDTDSDGDTLFDSVEAGPTPTTPVDSDLDGAPDYLDLDSNNDGTADGASTGGPDTDADGIPNQIDLDDDNDGILDVDEGAVDATNDGFLDASSVDTDSDGTPDAWDLDSDNDGILDNQESRLDLALVQSLDQVVNGAIDIGVAVGNNGLADIIETSPDSGVLNYAVVDTDGDGTPDFQDIDSDNDGINDLVEAGGGDLDNDGRIDGFADADGKGVDDFVQSNALPVFDTDGDGLADFRDPDSDNDTIPDQVEAGPTPNVPADTDGDGAFDYREQDSDGDTLPDNVEAGGNPSAPVDTDNDGAPDFQDTDSDNDTIPDNQEQPAAPNAPANTDMDGDGIDNSLDIDDDNDGILDTDEGAGDTDGDGVANQYDLDSDNDGLFDVQEASTALSHSISLDANGDGIIDGNSFGPNGFADVLETSPESGQPSSMLANVDGDSAPDFLDIDSDNDSIYDTLESNHPDANVDGVIDFTGSVTTSGVIAGVTGGAFVDTDTDGIVDFRDLDSDNDALVDLVEATGNDSDGDGRIDSFTDADGDGANDAQAQSPVIPPDTDGDRILDFRDLDSDNDGLSDLLESAGPQLDVDNNGVIDNFLDGNGDGRDDNVAATPVSPNDTDEDTFPDHLDLDSDGDGLSDLSETFGGDTNQDGVVDSMLDTDSDGVPDVVDSDQTGGTDTDSDSIDDSFDQSFAGGPDTDGDGIVDSADPDADGDGFAGVSDDGASSNQNLPDADNNGVPDFQQTNGNANTGNAPPTASAIVQTGLSGTGFGCSISTPLTTLEDEKKMIDPTFGILTLLAFGWLARCRRRSMLRIAAVTASTLILSGCGSIDLAGSRAQEYRSAQEFNRRVYIGAGAGVTRLEPDATKVPNVSVADTASAGGQLALGYDLSNRFSVEVHGGVLGAAAMNPDGEIAYQVGGLSGLYYGLNDEYARGRREGFSLFGRLGVGGMKNQAKVIRFERVNDFHLLAGIGIEYGFDSGLAARAELVSFDKDAQIAQLGLVYRFGDHKAPAPIVPPPAPAPAPLPEPMPIPQWPVDSDQDGVPDDFDACPSSPFGSPVNDQGCPLFSGVIEGVNFETSSAKLTAEAVAILQGTAQTLLEFPDVRVTVEAHTDNQGSAASNLQLSKRRAISVAKFLVEQGVAGNRLQPQAFGESKPRASNATAEGRKMNRRVEFNTL